MDSVPCLACSTFFVLRNKSQQFCSNSDCQRVRKRLWQKEKLATDPDYREEQRLAQKKWLQNNPGYWKNYRREHPEQAARNRSLQKIRNMKKRIRACPESNKTVVIAKMDARKSRPDRLSGQYWLVPMVAKMDAVKIFIASIPSSYR